MTTPLRSLNAYTVLFLSLATGVSGQVLGAGPSVTQDKFPTYHPAHTVIKCPYLPPGMADVPRCAGKPANCVGTDAHDLILGSEEADVIVAGAGNDVVHADAGDDTVCGGPGNDSLMGARGSDTLFGGPGDDWLFGAPESDQLFGDEGDFDVLWGGPGLDKLDGGPGDYDVCLLQRELGEANGGCDTVYPPPGYEHDEDPDPGLLKESEPLKLK